ncbi:MAG: hypothetical protein ACTSUE_09495 [Promethearchaeota archaeon]
MIWNYVLDNDPRAWHIAYPLLFHTFAYTLYIGDWFMKLVYNSVYFYTIYLIFKRGIAFKCKEDILYTIVKFLIINPLYWIQVLFYGVFDSLVGCLILFSMILVEEKKFTWAGIVTSACFLLKFIGAIVIFAIIIKDYRDIKGNPVGNRDYGKTRGGGSARGNLHENFIIKSFNFLKNQIRWNVVLLFSLPIIISYAIGFYFQGFIIFEPFFSQSTRTGLVNPSDLEWGVVYEFLSSVFSFFITYNVFFSILVPITAILYFKLKQLDTLECSLISIGLYLSFSKTQNSQFLLWFTPIFMYYLLRNKYHKSEAVRELRVKAFKIFQVLKTIFIIVYFIEYGILSDQGRDNLIFFFGRYRIFLLFFTPMLFTVFIFLFVLEIGKFEPFKFFKNRMKAYQRNIQ